jgi:hypothetical protein
MYKYLLTFVLTICLNFGIKEFHFSIFFNGSNKYKIKYESKLHSTMYLLMEIDIDQLPSYHSLLCITEVYRDVMVEWSILLKV